MTDPLFDPGLQPERTELAWRRSALSIAVGSLVSMRVLPESFGSPLGIVPGVVGLMMTGVIWVRARARYQAYYRAFETERAAHLPDGRLPLLLTGLSCTAGAVGLAVVGMAAIERGW